MRDATIGGHSGDERARLSDGSPRGRTVPVWLAIGATVLFLVHAANYLYFFVDDEAIPFVYAQNLLHGKGLSYSALEGRLEGYSDFLQVLWSSVILAGVRAARLPKDSVFFVGKAVSLLCGVGILLIVWMLLRRTRSGLTAGITALGTLALAGPLAVWSCSSLETAPFALMGTGLVAALVLESDGWAAATAALLVLERIDGFVYAGLLVAVFIVTASPRRRVEMARRIVLPLSAVLVAYHGWRWWYFRDFVPSPVETKILYKLMPHRNLIVKKPDEAYVVRFISVYGLPGTLAFIAAAAHALMTEGWMRRLTLAALLLGMYVVVVGDWMFGFRFFVMLLPLVSLILANLVNAIDLTRPRLAAVACAMSLGYAGVVAVRFFDSYALDEKAESFVRSPSLDLHRFFWPYYGLYEMARRLMLPGEVVAYNQSGFVPFMLDVNNIDDLGICSRFPADVPSTDIYFTEVGRYSPLTNKKTLRPVEAYFLYENARFVMSRTDILVRANHDSVPMALLGGYYELVGTDPQGLNAIYRRSENSQVAIEPGLFAENVAHVSYVRDVRIGGLRIDPQEYIQRLPFLHDQAGPIPFRDRTEMVVEFSDADQPVREISIEELRASTDAEVHVRLLTKDGRVEEETSVSLRAGRGRSVWLPTPEAHANRLVLTISAPGATGELWISDLRVQGQRPALQEYVARHLRFPRENPQDY